MPDKGDEPEKSEVLKVRISQQTRMDALDAKNSGAHKTDAESTFLGYLVELGLARYMKAILPIELGEDEGKKDRPRVGDEEHLPSAIKGKDRIAR